MLFSIIIYSKRINVQYLHVFIEPRLLSKIRQLQFTLIYFLVSFKIFFFIFHHPLIVRDLNLTQRHTSKTNKRHSKDKCILSFVYQKNNSPGKFKLNCKVHTSSFKRLLELKILLSPCFLLKDE